MNVCEYKVGGPNLTQYRIGWRGGIDSALLVYYCLDLHWLLSGVLLALPLASYK